MPQGVQALWQLSSARRIALNGLLPLPRGVVPADLPPLVWPAKDPGDVLDYALDLSAALAGDPTDQVASVGVVVQPSGNPGDLVTGSVVANGTSAVVWFSAGVAGTTYAVQLSIGTLKGRVISRSVLLPVQSLAAAASVNNPLTTSTGSIVTDQNGNPILIGT
jgi:hypothetical protein